jgi:tetratricopeptide (TPR) repeat protein
MLAGLYVKQHRLYEAEKILQVLMDIASDGCGEGVDYDRDSILHLLEACKTGIARWETRQVQMEQLLEKASKEYGSHLESGNFYLRVGDYNRARDAYYKAIEKDEARLGKSVDDPVEDSILKAQLVASFYGLAKTYIAMNDVEDAVKALDMGSDYSFKMDRMAARHGEDMRRLLTDLYERCGKGGGARSLHERAIPDSTNGFGLG